MDQELIKQLKRLPPTVGILVDSFAFRLALKEIMDLARFANKYFNDKMPWLTIKKDKGSCDTTIYLCLETIKTLAILLKPFLPDTAQKIGTMLNLDQALMNEWDNAGKLSLKAGHAINEPQILFTKIENDKIDRELG